MTWGDAMKDIKEIVWRCVNRLEYGTKFCSHSPSIPEEELHQAIVHSRQEIEIYFIGGYTQKIDLI